MTLKRLKYEPRGFHVLEEGSETLGGRQGKSAPQGAFSFSPQSSCGVLARPQAFPGSWPTVLFAMGSCYISSTMDSAALRAFLRNRSAWLLALVLLLPLAQIFAALHVISHAQAEEVAPADGSYAVHQKVCNVCLTAAAITGGALPSNLVDSVQVTVSGAAPWPNPPQLWFASSVRAYESRAPPFTRY